MTDLASWDALKSQHPKLFVGMYQFWCQRGGDGLAPTADGGKFRIAIWTVSGSAVCGH